MFRIHWTQHAVGHGGFHTGEASAEGKKFNWIFDCGAKKAAVLNHYLSIWATARQSPIDWLFISHFDTDHVNGLDSLMSAVAVKDVMVPYVNERELALQLLEGMSRASLDGPLVELVADPAAFFISRGAQRVTYFRGPNFDDGSSADPTPSSPLETPASEELGGWASKIDPQPLALPTPRRFRSRASDPPRVFVMDARTARNGGEISAVCGRAILRLKPYRAPIMSAAHLGLLNQLQALAGTTPQRARRPGLGKLAFDLEDVMHSAPWVRAV